jgi:hypothetical protein
LCLPFIHRKFCLPCWRTSHHKSLSLFSGPIKSQVHVAVTCESACACNKGMQTRWRTMKQVTLLSAGCQVTVSMMVRYISMALPYSQSRKEEWKRWSWPWPTEYIFHVCYRTPCSWHSHSCFVCGRSRVQTSA